MLPAMTAVCVDFRICLHAFSVVCFGILPPLLLFLFAEMSVYITHGNKKSEKPLCKKQAA